MHSCRPPRDALNAFNIPPPPIPTSIGLVTACAIAVATAASIAFPPFLKISSPACAAYFSGQVTTPPIVFLLNCRLHRRELLDQRGHVINHALEHFFALLRSRKSRVAV